MRLGRFAVLLAAFLGVLFPAAASGAIVSGSNLSLPPSTTICVLPGQLTLDCTTTITGLPGATTAPGGPRAGISGVITSWSIRTGPSTIDHSVRLRVVRGDAGVGTGSIETLPKAFGTYTYAAQLPVKKDDFLGVDTLDVPELLGVPIIRTNTGAFLDYWSVALADGETRPPANNEQSNLELLMNATIEPDADGDGFGDETQDKCLGSAGGNEGCPPPVGPPTPQPPTAAPTPGSAQVPETILGKRPSGTIHTRKATFRFNADTAGSTFQCKLDKKPFRFCKSPKTHKGLSEGKHTFKVRAVGPTGLIDPTPGKRTFKVEL